MDITDKPYRDLIKKRYDTIQENYKSLISSKTYIDQLKTEIEKSKGLKASPRKASPRKTSPRKASKSPRKASPRKASKSPKKAFWKKLLTRKTPPRKASKSPRKASPRKASKSPKKAFWKKLLTRKTRRLPVVEIQPPSVKGAIKGSSPTGVMDLGYQPNY
jgi:hypothetical protein